MRTPGHSGTHLPGTAFKLAMNSQYGKEPVMKMSSPQTADLNPFGSKRAKWVMVGAGTVLWFLICFQIFVDVYVLAVR